MRRYDFGSHANWAARRVVWTPASAAMVVSALMLGCSKFGKIEGGVVDRLTDKPIHGVSVTVKGTSLTALTDDAGHYTITNVLPGPQKVEASKDGFIALGEVELTAAKGMKVPAATLYMMRRPLGWPDEELEKQMQRWRDLQGIRSGRKFAVLVAEATTKRNLGAIRNALTISPNVESAFKSAGMPAADTRHHPETSGVVKVRCNPDLKLRDSGGWAYCANGDSNLGATFFVDCTHTDTKGKRWSEY